MNTSVQLERTRAESEPQGTPPGPFSQSIGRTRYVVLLAVAAVMLVAISLFLLGTIQAVVGVWNAWREMIASGFGASSEEGTAVLTVEFLELVSVMLKAVVFYIIGVGLYSLFIAPLNVTVALGVETLNDLENKVISVVIVILGVTFLEHFILWEEPIETLQFGAAMAVVVAALVLFQMHSHRAKEDQKANNPDVQKRAQRELFQNDAEEMKITPDLVEGTNNRADGR